MVIVTTLLLVAALSLGCDRTPPGAPAAEQLRAAIAAETGDTNTVLSTEDGGIRIQSGGDSLAVIQRRTSQRPAGIPADIALPADARFDLWTEGPRGSTISLLTDLPPRPLEDFFREQWSARSWQESSTVEADTLRRLAFVKESRQAVITIEPDPEHAPATRALLFIETAAAN